jgi:hypothetical protein
MKQWLTILLTLATIAIIVLPRFYQLGSTPPGLHIDEVSFAADAKSLAETGKDTWGQRSPRVFKAFGEYKAPGLTYSMAFWSLLSGTMNNTIARLPSATAGIVSLVMLILTLRLIVPTMSHYISLAIALVLAFSPWHFDMSRIFYEAMSAMAWFSVSLYFATKIILKKGKNPWWLWVAVAATAALSGYYYASTRYLIILYCLLVPYLALSNSRAVTKKSLVTLITLALCGIGWIGDLFSDVGLNRLHYYQQKANLGHSLQIDEKRQFCYLALNRDEVATKWCYALWNKPLERVTGAADTMITYLGTDFLFLGGESEYGFDSQYGAYLPPLLIVFIIGLFATLQSVVAYVESIFRKSGGSAQNRVFTLYIIVALASLVPAALALNLNMRMGMIMLYIVGIIIGYGFYLLSRWLQLHTIRWVSAMVILGYIAVIAFYSLQALTHYFFVFTKSNDLQWTSDAGPIFNYVKSISGQYDRIVDTELHGPLAPYFYGDVTTAEVQNGERSKPDDIGFTYLVKAGKYELRHINIKDLACEVVSAGDKRRTLVITNPYPELTSMRKYESRSWNGALLLHEVYDLGDVISYMERSEPGFRARCTPK